MISREESIRRYDYGTEDDDVKLLNAIYDSIGSCGECKHYVVRDGDINEMTCLILDWTDSTGASDDFFCADFERKEDEA